MEKLAIFQGLLVLMLSFPLSAQGDDVPGACKDCHSDLIGQEHMHYPAEDACDNCHTAKGNEHPQDGVPGFELAEPLPGLCFLCHEEYLKSSLHAPVEMGECLMCHSAHGSENPDLLLKSTEVSLCGECHDLSMANKKFKHQALEAGTCSSCHNPHESGYASLLKNQKQALCLDCHEKLRNEASLPWQHYPFEDDCGSCHEAHSSELHTLLKMSFPAGIYAGGQSENFELCFSCHDRALMEEEETSTSTAFRDGKKNLHFLHLNGGKARSCKLCHNIHGSSNKFLLADVVPFGHWNMPVGFAPSESGGSCNTGCHARISYSR